MQEVFQVTRFLTWANEVRNGAPIEQDQIDRDLGYIAVDLAESLAENQASIGYLGGEERRWLTMTTVHSAISDIQSYDYAAQHFFTNWWNR